MKRRKTFLWLYVSFDIDLNCAISVPIKSIAIVIKLIAHFAKIIEMRSLQKKLDSNNSYATL